MKTISTALQNFLLDNTTFQRADLITISLPNGQFLRVVYGTNQDITYLGNTYYTSKYGAWERGAYTNKAEFKPSSENFEITAFIPETVMFPGTSTPLMQVLNLGVLAGSQVNIQTLFWPDQALPSAGFSMGTMQLTTGQIGNIKQTGRSKIVCEIFDLLYVLNRPFPPTYIQSSCRHTLFDPGCTLLLSNYISTNLTIALGSTTTSLLLNIPSRTNATPYVKGNVIVLGSPAILYLALNNGTSAGSPPAFNPLKGAITLDGTVDWQSMQLNYALGYVLFNGGQNAGFRYAIKAVAGILGTNFQLLKPVYFPLTVGDTVQIVPGCDKTTVTCGPPSATGGGVYNNLIHFGGMPYVPNPEIAQ